MLASFNLGKMEDFNQHFSSCKGWIFREKLHPCRPNPDAHDVVGTIDSVRGLSTTGWFPSAAAVSTHCLEDDFSVLAVTADVVVLPEVQSVIIDSFLGVGKGEVSILVGLRGFHNGDGMPMYALYMCELYVSASLQVNTTSPPEHFDILNKCCHFCFSRSWR